MVSSSKGLLCRSQNKTRFPYHHQHTGHFMHCLYLNEAFKDSKEDILVLSNAFSKLSQNICNVKSKGPYCGKNNSGQVVVHLQYSSSCS